MMRSVEDIRADVTRAVREMDLAALHRLRAELKTHPDKLASADTLRLTGILASLDGDTDTAITCFNRAREIYVELQDDQYAALIDNDLGTAYSHRGEYEISQAHYHAAVDKFMAMDRANDALPSMFNIALFWSRMGQFERALEQFDKTRAIAIACNDQIMLGMIFNSVAMIHQRRSEFDRALEYLHRALDIAQTINSTKVTFFALRGLGITYMEIGDLPTSLGYLHRAYDSAMETGHKARLSQIAVSIGNLHYQLNELDPALEWQRKALAIDEELGDILGTAAVVMNIANINHVRGNIVEAIALYERSLATYRRVGDHANTASVLCNMAACLLKVGRYAEGRPLLDEAETLADVEPGTVFLFKQLRAGMFKADGDLATAEALLLDALSLAEQHHMRLHVAAAHEDLRDIALLKNDLASYVRHNTACTEIRAELTGVATAQRIAAQEAERRIASERQEREKERAVLYSTLPKHIADKLVRGEQVTGDHFDNAAVLFVDIVGFTTLSSSMPSADVVALLDNVFESFDAICQKHGVTKIKTIGDSYMAVAFPSESSSSEQRVASLEERAASAALAMLDAVSHIHSGLPNGPLGDLPNGLLEDLPNGLQVRIGLHSGPVTAGIIGKERMQYDVWGDTVNVASRMESTSEPGKIHVSSSFALALKGEKAKERNGETAKKRNGETAKKRNGETAVIPSVSEERGSKYMTPGTWHMEPRGEVEIKGKGMMTTYWLESIT